MMKVVNIWMNMKDKFVGNLYIQQHCIFWTHETNAYANLCKLITMLADTDNTLYSHSRRRTYYFYFLKINYFNWVEIRPPNIHICRNLHWIKSKRKKNLCAFAQTVKMEQKEEALRAGELQIVEELKKCQHIRKPIKYIKNL